MHLSSGEASKKQCCHFWYLFNILWRRPSSFTIKVQLTGRYTLYWNIIASISKLQTKETLRVLYHIIFVMVSFYCFEMTYNLVFQYFVFENFKNQLYFLVRFWSMCICLKIVNKIVNWNWSQMYFFFNALCWNLYGSIVSHVFILFTAIPMVYDMIRESTEHMTNHMKSETV